MATEIPPMTATKSWVLDMAWLVVGLSVLYFAFLGSRPLFTPDEGRYAEIAREMSLSADWVTPYLNGVKYFEKPILFYWLGATAFKWFGVNLWSIRSINAVLGIVNCLATYSIARRLFSRQTGIIAALILSTSLLFFVMSHMISLDLTVTALLSLSLYSSLLGCLEQHRGKRRAYVYAAATFAALAVLTKGLIGIVLPIMIIACWLTILGEWRLLKRLYLPSSFLIFMLIATPWHVLLQHKHPEFFSFYFIEQHFLRYTDAQVGHYGPIWFFIPYLLLGFLPWTLLLPGAIKSSLPPTWHARKQFAVPLFFLIWVVVIFVFFSLSKSKLIPYILPLFPAISILTARYISLRSMRTMIIFCMTSITSILLLLLMWFAPSLDTRTILPLANRLKTQLRANDIVVTYNQYYQDLPFYLERKVSILNWKNELRYGMAHQDTRTWMLDDATFWHQWRSQQHVYVFISREELATLKRTHPHDPSYLVASTQLNALISNQPPSAG